MRKNFGWVPGLSLVIHIRVEGSVTGEFLTQINVHSKSIRVIGGFFDLIERKVGEAHNLTRLLVGHKPVCRIVEAKELLRR